MLLEEQERSILTRRGTSSTTRQHQDSGSYAYYAGPVYVSAPGQCVWYGGQDSGSGGWWGEGPVACG